MSEKSSETGERGGNAHTQQAVVKLQGAAVEAAEVLIDIIHDKKAGYRERRFAAIAILDRVGIVAGVHVEATGKDGAPLEHLSFEQLVAVIKGANSNRR